MFTVNFVEKSTLSYKNDVNITHIAAKDNDIYTID